MEKLIPVGLINGRHNLPVSTFIFETVKDPFDFMGLTIHTQRFLDRLFEESADAEGNQADGIILYVTGLTPVLTAVLSVCVGRCAVTLMHYDRETGDYHPQFFKTWE